MTAGPAVSTPVSATVYFVDPEVDPSSFEHCTVRPDGAFLVIQDLTKKAAREVTLIPAARIDTVLCVERT